LYIGGGRRGFMRAEIVLGKDVNKTSDIDGFIVALISVFNPEHWARRLKQHSMCASQCHHFCVV
jgi:hypothetical protein